MGQLYSFHNEARDIYRNSRRMAELLVKAGKVKPDDLEAAFREIAGKQLKQISMPLPKAWGNATPPATPTPRMQPEAKVTVSQSVSSAVAAGVIVGGAINITQNLHQVLTGHKEFQIAAKDVVTDVVTAGASSVVIAGTAEGIKFGIKSALPNIAKSFVKGSAPVVIASGVVELAVDAYKGNLTAKTATITVARTAGGWAGAEAGAVGGAAVGAFLATVTAGASVVLCAFIGGILGGIGGSLGGGKLAELAVS